MTNTLSDVAGKTFDYVIVGGGASGLTLAARLSEDPSVTVAVIEAGKANLDDPNILIPGQALKMFFNPDYDWSFFTTKQRHCNDLTLPWIRGKSLGGSTSINLMNWSKPSAWDVNAFETLGNKGWDWESFVKYSRKSERFHEPTEEELAVFPQAYDYKFRGDDGPVQTSIAHHVHSLEKPLLDTLKQMGLPVLKEPYGGDTAGGYLCSSTIDPRTQTRSYAATAYYLPNKDRRNLTVLTEAHVNRVLFAEHASANEELTATGVEFFWTQNAADAATPCIVHARKEVILSAGTIKTPQILELSGVGSEKVLTQLGVDIKINLPGVGENVQEHLYSAILYELDNKVDHQTLDSLKDPAVAAKELELFASQKGMLRTCPTAFAYLPLSFANPQDAPSLIAKVAQDVETLKSSGSLPPGLAEQFDLQLQALRDDTIPEMEIVAYPGSMSQTYQLETGKKYVTTILFMQHPFSRGTIHAVSKDATQPPEIDPHHFENDFDLEILVQDFKFLRSMANVEPWKSTVAREVEPGPSCSTDEEIREFIKNSVKPVWHAVGSCSMLPREKQGVVDYNLKVYGTKNLRVVDISIIPLMVTGHTQTIAYFVGEKAADIIRGCA